MNKQTMGEFLATLRKANGFTQQEVAEKLNVSNRTLSSWETDRTTPDVLLLPAIADLYGVTADEILRGERSENEKSTELSNKAMLSVLKRLYSKFCFKCSLLTPFGCFSTFFLILSSLLMLYTNTELWAEILLAVLGLSGLATCGILLTAFYSKAKSSMGIVLADDYTDDKKECALALKRKAQNYFWICALPFIIASIVLLIVYKADILRKLNNEIMNSVSYIPRLYESFEIIALKTWHEPYLIAIISNAVIGIGLLVGFIVFSNVGIANLLNDEQKETKRQNLMQLKTISLLCIIPFLFIWGGLFATYLFGLKELLTPIIVMPIIFAVIITLLLTGIIYGVKRTKQEYVFK